MNENKFSQPEGGSDFSGSEEPEIIDFSFEKGVHPKEKPQSSEDDLMPSEDMIEAVQTSTPVAVEKIAQQEEQRIQSVINSNSNLRDKAIQAAQVVLNDPNLATMSGPWRSITSGLGSNDANSK
jgi:hypothetical protein